MLEIVPLTLKQANEAVGFGIVTTRYRAVCLNRISIIQIMLIRLPHTNAETY
jgi:hypothetical protein